jgi:hypothetical protein
MILFSYSGQKGAQNVNQYMENKWSWIEGTDKMRGEVLDTLTDNDLRFNPGGQNMTLGALFREMGEIQYSYNQSLKTFTQNFDYHNTEAGLDTSTAKLKAWYKSLDEEMKSLVEAFSDDDLKKTIDRGGGFAMPVEVQLDVYLQAMLISFGKLSVFLKAMGRPLPDSIKDWIW